MARFEHENKVRRKELKPEKNGIHLFLESGIHCAGIRNPVPAIRNPQHGIQNPRLSWIPLHGATNFYPADHVCMYSENTLCCVLNVIHFPGITKLYLQPSSRHKVFLSLQSVNLSSKKSLQTIKQNKKYFYFLF